jgi:hypothetical protein
MSAMLPAINTKVNTCTVNTPFYELLETGELKRKTTSMDVPVPRTTFPTRKTF